MKYRIVIENGNPVTYLTVKGKRENVNHVCECLSRYFGNVTVYSMRRGLWAIAGKNKIDA